MKALIRDKYGSPDVLEVREVKAPIPKDDQVLVRVFAASINDWDWGYLTGTSRLNRVLCGIFSPRIKILGCDIAGRVESVGRKVKRFKPGDEVYGDLCRNGFGGFAEYVCTRENALAMKSPRMSFEQAAAIPQAGMLAIDSFMVAGPLRSGQKILINGAGGGVGTLGIQLLKLPRFAEQGIEITGVDSADKFDMLRSMGFDRVIDYRTQDFTQGDERYDVIIDVKTNRHPSEYARVLKPGGIYATSGGIPKRLLQAAFIGPRIGRPENKRFKGIALKPSRDLAYFNELFDAGKLTPVIDGSYTLSEGRNAFQYFGEAKHKGKIVITIATA
jgi:NADPH:quinone reductase-like Zn-dependent oxidoreductase